MDYSHDASLSRLVSPLIVIAGGLFLLNGLPMYFAPAWSAANFSWNITPFTAMTIGGWCLGSAAFVLEMLRHRRLSTAYPGAIYLATFGLFLGLTLFVHRDKLNLNALLAWPYLVMLAVSIVAGILGIIEWIRVGAPSAPENDAPVPWWVRVMVAGFVALVGVLGVILVVGSARPGKAVFPTEMTAFTAHAFGAFYLCLVAAILPLLWARGLSPIVGYMRAGLILIGVITIAIVVNLGLFDFVNRPGGWIYVAAYVIAFVGGGIIVAYDWLLRRAEAAVPASGGEA
jgi:hypothetical protein